MRFIEWRHRRWTWMTLFTPNYHYFLHFASSFLSLEWLKLKTSIFFIHVGHIKCRPWGDKLLSNGRYQGHVPILKFWGFNHIFGTGKTPSTPAKMSKQTKLPVASTLLLVWTGLKAMLFKLDKHIDCGEYNRIHDNREDYPCKECVRGHVTLNLLHIVW